MYDDSHEKDTVVIESRFAAATSLFMLATVVRRIIVAALCQCPSNPFSSQISKNIIPTSSTTYVATCRQLILRAAPYTCCYI